ncbi:MAG: thiamine phosphate synthase [Phycisphaerales bacterium]|nr:thiamine phosphate synthase [Phycisphaerales bacterium]
MDRDIARIIDANFNRAREAARVLEDYARFVLNDPAGTAVVKQFRHDLAGCLGRLPANTLLIARDTPGDVGTSISTATERQRTDLDAVLIAAAKRLPEALRTIEEYAKTFDPDLAAAVESLRYRSYDLEQRLRLRGKRAGRFSGVRMYVLITESLCHGDWFTTAEQAIAGGAGCLQLREKALEDDELLKRARLLAELCRRNDVLFIVNDRPDIAFLSEADGVHLGQTDLPVAEARRIVGPGCLIGLSTHTPEQLYAAIEQQPDYIAVGPMFPSSTKPQEHVPGPELLKAAVARTAIPLVCIGGIKQANLSILIEAGVRCAAVCSAVIGCADVRAETTRLASVFDLSG